ncbi:MAG: glutamate-5-semialdehyde dehydrogenase [Phycisphaerales bacterium]|nr:glutamate-5-semialdehyde dehydrogenase [Phycisphaerales bacterium]
MSVAEVDVALVAAAARRAGRGLAGLSTLVKNAVLVDLAAALRASWAGVQAANDADVRDARAGGLDEAKIARLTLGPGACEKLCDSLAQLVKLPDPVGEVADQWRTESGMLVRRVRAPLGVVCMIYEARPGVTIEAFALCLKSGNACVLKGGKEAARSNVALAAVVHGVLRSKGIDEGALGVIATLSREGLLRLLQQRETIDLVIPRGGEELIRFVAEHSRIPTIQHYKGVNHLYVDEAADLEMAVKLAVTGKITAPATCNALECVLVHEAVAGVFLPRVCAEMVTAGVEVRCEARAMGLVGGVRGVVMAKEDDFGREFLSKVIAVKVVSSLAEAMGHIARYGSNHSEAIVTRSEEVAGVFCRGVDASCVLWNASTRMNDGHALGLGAEIGISTTKLHAYGPMGLRELTTTRFVVSGSGQTR